MKIYFIRHAMTKGNLEKRYIGRTDEPLCEEGREQLKALDIPQCDAVVCSPMKRCIETAQILFPGKEPIICDDLRECDFGSFEGKNYDELNGSEEYQKWIDSGGRMAFPGGEDPAEFKWRCIGGFEKVMFALGKCESAAFVVHGGTIMSILERYAVPHRDYYSYLTDNCHGYVCEFDGEKLTEQEKL